VGEKTEIDRAKLRAAIRKLGDEYVYFMLDEALDLLPDGKLAKLVGQYVDLKRLRPDGPGKDDLFGEVTEFERASRAREFYESFNVDSKNFTEKSNGTRSWIAECRRLLDRLVARSKKGDRGRVRTALETIFGLLRHIDEGCDDVIFFADEGGSWQVGVEWKTVFGAYFACLSRTAEPEEYARRVVTIIDEFEKPDRDKHLAVARRVATPAQRKALLAEGARARG
jgi:hypothetical protein